MAINVVVVLAAHSQFPVRVVISGVRGGGVGLWWGLWRGALEGRKAGETWMGGEEGSYMGGILPEVHRSKICRIIWA